MLVGALGSVDGSLKSITDGIKTAYVATKQYRQALNTGKRSSSQYRLHHGVLYYHHKGVMGVYVPFTNGLRKKLLVLYHDVPAAGQFGVQKSCRALAKHERRCGRTCALLSCLST
jgi:hypothetical protein